VQALTSRLENWVTANIATLLLTLFFGLRISQNEIKFIAKLSHQVANSFVPCEVARLGIL